MQTQAPDFIAHPHHGIGALTPGQKLHLQLWFRSARVSLTASPASDIADTRAEREELLS